MSDSHSQKRQQYQININSIFREAQLEQEDKSPATALINGLNNSPYKCGEVSFESEKDWHFQNKPILSSENTNYMEMLSLYHS